MKKMMIFALILFLLIPIFPKAIDTASDWDLLEDILDDFGGEAREADITFNGLISDKFMGKKEMTILGEDLVSKLELVGEEIDPFILSNKDLEDFYSKMVIFEENYSQINYNGYDKEKNMISININSYKNKDINLEETTISINVIKIDDYFKINDIIEKIEGIYEELDSEVDITSCLIGRVKGKLNKKEFSTKLNRSLKDINGSIVDEFSDDSFSSFTIYSPLVKNYLNINKKKININLSMRYNRDEDYTYLWIGTPIITAGY